MIFLNLFGLGCNCTIFMSNSFGSSLSWLVWLNICWPFLLLHRTNSLLHILFVLSNFCIHFNIFYLLLIVWFGLLIFFRSFKFHDYTVDLRSVGLFNVGIFVLSFLLKKCCLGVFCCENSPYSGSFLPFPSWFFSFSSFSCVPQVSMSICVFCIFPYYWFLVVENRI